MGWGWAWIPLGMQLDVNVDCGCEEADIVDVNVGICSPCPPPVSQVQECAGRRAHRERRQVSCSGKTPLSECALAPSVPLQCWERVGCAGKQRR